MLDCPSGCDLIAVSAPLDVLLAGHDLSLGFVVVFWMVTCFFLLDYIAVAATAVMMQLLPSVKVLQLQLHFFVNHMLWTGFFSSLT